MGKESCKFGEIVKYLRKKRRWSLQELSKKTDFQVSAGYILRLETAERKNPSLATISALAKAFEVDALDLIEATDKEKIKKYDMNNIADLFVRSDLVSNGRILGAREKEVLIEIIDLITNLLWEKDTMINEIHELLIRISEYKREITNY